MVTKAALDDIYGVALRGCGSMHLGHDITTINRRVSTPIYFEDLERQLDLSDRSRQIITDEVSSGIPATAIEFTLGWEPCRYLGFESLNA